MAAQFFTLLTEKQIRCGAHRKYAEVGEKAYHGLTDLAKPEFEAFRVDTRRQWIPGDKGFWCHRLDRAQTSSFRRARIVGTARICCAEYSKNMRWRGCRSRPEEIQALKSRNVWSAIAGLGSVMFHIYIYILIVGQLPNLGGQTHLPRKNS